MRKKRAMDKSAKNSNLTLQEPFLKLTNSIKHPNLPQQNSNAVQKKRRYPLIKFSRRLRGVVVLICGADLSPRRLWLSFQTPAETYKLTCARRAFWRSKPRRERVSLGLSAHLTRMARDPAAD
jgi:hypothetical protein